MTAAAHNWPPPCQQPGCDATARWSLPCLDCAHPVFLCSDHAADLFRAHTRTRDHIHTLCGTP